MSYNIKNKLFLASKSSARAEILTMMEIPFEILTINIDEKYTSTKPEEVVIQISEQKAMAAADILPEDSLILAADTLIFSGNRAIGKPKDESDAFQILRFLSDNSHFVCTGMTLINKQKGIFKSCSEKTIVRVGSISDEEINDFIKSGVPLNKAGAYAIQSKFSAYVESIEGCFYNIMGLPTHKLHLMLKSLEIA